MAVYTAVNFSAPAPNIGQACVAVTRVFSVVISATLVAADTIKLCPIPLCGGNGIIIEDFFINLPDLDGGTTLVWDLGDGVTANKYVAGSTKGRTAGIASAAVDGVAAIFPAKETVAGTLLMTATTGAASAGTGTIKGFMRYHILGTPAGF